MMLASPLAALLACAGCSSPAAEDAGVPLAGPCSVTDGDTIRCGDERIRLLGIDAPELPGHCRQGRRCAPGDPFASTEALRGAVARGDLTIRRAGRDRYGRTLAVVYAGGENLSCAQLRGGHAVYVRKWDDGGLVVRDCSEVER